MRHGWHRGRIAGRCATSRFTTTSSFTTTTTNGRASRIATRLACCTNQVVWAVMARAEYTAVLNVRYTHLGLAATTAGLASLDPCVADLLEILHLV